MGEHFKMVVVGDGDVGKSCLILTYTTKSFPGDYVPTVFGKYSTSINVRGTQHTIELWDTGGQEDYDKLRPLSYVNTDMVLLCFAVDRQASLDNVRDKWIPELRHYLPQVPILVVACKTDLRPQANLSERRKANPISYSQAFKVAAEVGASYFETSSITQAGLKDCLEQAVHLALNQPKKSKSKFVLKTSKKMPICRLPPMLPSPGKAPFVDIESSTFAEDWRRSLQDPTFHDVTFILEGGATLSAHRIILCAASQFFKELLTLVLETQTENGDDDEFGLSNYVKVKDIKYCCLEGISKGVATIKDSQTNIVVKLSPKIENQTFTRILEFLYSGDPDVDENTPVEEVEALKTMAIQFELPHLCTMCDNVLRGEKYLNPSITTSCNEALGENLKTLFLNHSKYADVVFTFHHEGWKLYAHKAVLSARSPVMAAMFGGNFLESRQVHLAQIPVVSVTSYQNYLAFLEYLYADHAPLEELKDVLGLLTLADEKGQGRLVGLCERALTQSVAKACARRIGRADIDVIDILNSAHTYNATQLVNWCRHWIASNFEAFSQTEEFSQLSPEDLQLVHRNRWPPLTYLKEVSDFEQEMNDCVKCVLM